MLDTKEKLVSCSGCYEVITKSQLETHVCEICCEMELVGDEVLHETNCEMAAQ